MQFFINEYSITDYFIFCKFIVREEFRQIKLAEKKTRFRFQLTNKTTHFCGSGNMTNYLMETLSKERKLSVLDNFFCIICMRYSPMTFTTISACFKGIRTIVQKKVKLIRSVSSNRRGVNYLNIIANYEIYFYTLKTTPDGVSRKKSGSGRDVR